MARIHLRSVLAEIDTPDKQGNAREFSIKYAKEDGDEGFKAKVRKAGSLGSGATHSTGRFRYNVKERGVLVVFDVAKEETRTLKIARLIEYNGVRIQHG
jgi:hypothetical protein